MSFELKLEKSLDSEGSQKIQIVAVGLEHAAATFIERVKQCVAMKCLDITITLNGFEGLFSQIHPHILKLNQFLKSKGHILSVTADELSPEVISQLEKVSIGVKVSTFKLNQILSALKDFEISGKLPISTAPWGDGEGLLNHYHQLMSQWQKLQRQKASFSAHFALHRKLKLPVDLSKKLKEWEVVHEKVKDLKLQHGELSREAKMWQSELELQLKSAEGFIQQSDLENKKKEEMLQKQMASEKERFSNFKKEFESKELNLTVAETGTKK